MKFNIKKSDLIEACSQATTFSEKRGDASVILASVLLCARDAVLEYTAGDRTVTLRGSVTAAVEQSGEVAVDAGYLSAAVKNMPGDVVAVVVSGKDKGLVRVELSSGSSSYKLVGQAAADYPVYTSDKTSKVVTVSAGDLSRLLDQSLFAVASDDNRYGLNGTHLEVADTQLRVVATDGNRLQWSQCAFDGELGVGKKHLVPRRAWSAIQKLVAALDETASVTIAFGERSVLVSGGAWKVRSLLLEADFPDYKQVIPSTFKRSAVVDRAALQTALRRVMLFASDNSHTFKFQLVDADLTGGTRVILTSRKVDAGEAREEVPVELTGDVLATGFNVKFLQDALGAFVGEKVTMQFGDALAPCVIIDSVAANVLSVVMPLRLE